MEIWLLIRMVEDQLVAFPVPSRFGCCQNSMGVILLHFSIHGVSVASSKMKNNFFIFEVTANLNLSNIRIRSIHYYGKNECFALIITYL